MKVLYKKLLEDQEEFLMKSQKTMSLLSQLLVLALAIVELIDESKT